LKILYDYKQYIPVITVEVKTTDHSILTMLLRRRTLNP
jgi:hypothetical protein